MLLSRELCQLTVVIHPWSERAFRQWQVPVNQIVTWSVQSGTEVAESLLRKENPALVLTSAGGGDSLDKLFIYAARQQGIPTLTLLDYWTSSIMGVITVWVSTSSEWVAAPELFTRTN